MREEERGWRAVSDAAPSGPSEFPERFNEERTESFPSEESAAAPEQPRSLAGMWSEVRLLAWADKAVESASTPFGPSSFPGSGFRV